MTELLNTLYVHTQGSHLQLDHDAVLVRVDAEQASAPVRLPLLRIESIVVFGRVTLSPALLARCADDGRAVVWLDRNGRFRARLQGRVGGNVLLRRAQHLALDDDARRLRLARNIVAGKLQNSRRVLLRAARDAIEEQARDGLRTAAAEIGDGMATLDRQASLDAVRGVEGRGARVYFHALRHALRADGTSWSMDGRTRRPPRDPVNALLSFLYALLQVACWSALESVGLDPQVGYLHGLRPGRPALALDLMEEHRPVIADRLALTLLNRRQLATSDFDALPGGAVRLTEGGRRTVLEEWQRARLHEHPHRLLGRRVPAGLLPHVQARLLARHLRGDLQAYIPFTIRG